YQSSGMTKMINQFEVWNMTDNVKVTATDTDAVGVAPEATAGAIIRADADADAGYNVIFIPETEEVIGVGKTRTYELKGMVLSGVSLKTGDAILTKIDDLATAATSSNFADVSRNLTDFVREDVIWVDNYATTSASFIWSDRSGASEGAHTLTTGDWTNDYKVNGITTLSPLCLQF
ncbi:unnamed protein product, partial [marine sediment metagenome]